jgi:hypothetical protein
MTRGEYKAEITQLEKNVIIEEGLDFMLSHFSNPLFPRMVSTAATNKRQREVDSKERVILYFKGAFWEDCRIAGYGVDQTNPDLIFIELDKSSFISPRAFRLALTTTLKNIKEKIGGHPTVLWSGRGYHIIQPIDCPIPLEQIKELEALEPNTSNKFLQFAERYLSNNKSDSGHHPAIKSCMLRIPGSINSKSKSEVKIIQRWDGHRPDYRLLIGSFYADMVGERQKKKKYEKNFSLGSNEPKVGQLIIPWIERLLQTPIEEYRKHARDLILVPYLVINKGLTDEDEICDIIMKWADKCDEVRRLDPSMREFEKRVYSRIDEVRRNRIWHMKLETLKEKNYDLWKRLNESSYHSKK